MKNQKEIYQEAEMKMVSLSKEDIVTVSPGGRPDEGELIPLFPTGNPNEE